MEPPVKRSRVGPSPLDTEPDDDELISRPEEVNQRRDPGYQLQKSRAFAAFKLKSAFERIFEKYEKDFTGVGDEIDLRTGEIVVDNGHIQSLKTVQLNALEDDQDSEADEEERILQGKPDNRLSRLVQNPMPLTIQPRAPISPSPWLCPPQQMAGPPFLSSMLHSGNMKVGNHPLGMQYAAPAPMPCFDPTWSVPELPVTAFGPGFQPSSAPRKKEKMRLITSAAAEDDNEDDLLLGVSTTPSAISAGRERFSSPSKHTPSRSKDAPADSEPPTSRGSVSKEPTKVTGSSTKPMKKPGSQQKRTAKKPIHHTKSPDGSSPMANIQRVHLTEKRAPASVVPETPSSERLAASGVSEPMVAKETPKQTSITKKKKTVPNARRRKALPPEASASDTSPHERSEAELYHNPSQADGGFSTKPSNQKLAVVIRKRSPAKSSLYAVIAPETEPEPENAQLMQADQNEESSSDGPDTDNAEESFIPDDATHVVREDEDPSEQNNNANQPDRHADHGSSAAEVFSRNTLDPSYAFSDEDEPLLPRRSRVPISTGIVGHKNGEELPGESPVADAPTSSLSKKPRRKSKTVVHSDLELAGGDLDDLSSAPVTAEESPHRPVQTMRHSRPRVDEVLDLEVPCSEDAAPEEPPQPWMRHESMLQDSPPNNDESLVLDSIEQFWNLTSSALESSPIPSRKRKQRPSERAEEQHPLSSEVELPRYSPLRYPVNHAVLETPEPEHEPLSPLSNLPQQPSPELGFEDGSDHILPLSTEDAPPQDLTNNHPSPPPEPSEAPKDAPAPKSTTKPRSTSIPKTPSSRTARRLSRFNPTSSAKSSLLSLLSDDEDELSLGPEDFTPSGSRIRRPSPSNDPTSTSRVRSYLSTTKLTKRGVILGTSSGGGKKSQPRTPASAKGRFRPSYLSRQSGGGTSVGRVSTLAICAGAMMRLGPPSPVSKLGSELIRTPGGHLRRCGEGDFRCDRDFCFVCLR